MNATGHPGYTGTRWIFRLAWFGIQPLVAACIVAIFFAPVQFHLPLLLAALLLVLFGLLLSVTATRKFIEQSKQRMAAEAHIRASKIQMEELFSMTDMLQSADGHEDAGAVLEATAKRLLPDLGGALYVFNNSRDRLDLIRSWNVSESIAPIETMLPTTCWAIKRGKTHINSGNAGGLSCFHNLYLSPSIEIPMMARGNLFGLLVFIDEAADAAEGLRDIEKIARALADSMSLSLSNIALNEKLTAQSMRDPLTGLYNRRYMEDALERALTAAERNGDATSVVMIDLDNFKKLNDEHGHAKGDAVLRDVAAHLTGALRQADTVSRYGGEELFIIMPNTDLDDAASKAETLRAGVERLSEDHGVAVSASFGVAEYPHSTSDAKTLIKLADEALYAAKAGGKNCVRRAKPADRSGEFQPKLVAQDGVADEAAALEARGQA